MDSLVDHRTPSNPYLDHFNLFSNAEEAVTTARGIRKPSGDANLQSILFGEEQSSFIENIVNPTSPRDKNKPKNKNLQIETHTEAKLSQSDSSAVLKMSKKKRFTSLGRSNGSFFSKKLKGSSQSQLIETRRSKTYTTISGSSSKQGSTLKLALHLNQSNINNHNEGNNYQQISSYTQNSTYFELYKLLLFGNNNNFPVLFAFK